MLNEINEQNNWKESQISYLVNDLWYDFTILAYMFEICKRMYNDSDVSLSRLNLLGVLDCIQNHASGTRSLISSSSYLVSARAQTFNPRVGKGDFKKFRLPTDWTHGVAVTSHSSFAWIPARCTAKIFLFFFFLQESHAAEFCKPWRTNADVTLLCGVPPMVGVTSGGGAEHRKPIVASTRPNHLRFCGQAIHVPSSFSQYSLTEHLDRD